MRIGRRHLLSFLWAAMLFAEAAHAQVVNELVELLASDGATGDFFGLSVSIHGDTAVVGAEGDDDSGSLSGSAYVFVRDGGAWTEQAKLVASDGASQDFFGASVAVHGDTALVGAWGDGFGSAYVFVRNGDVWTEQAKLVPSDGAAFDNFGISVAVHEDTALVGADGPGSAYVFTRSGVSWSQQARLVASDGDPTDGFGESVAVHEETAVVGAEGDDDNGLASGSAYVFVRSGTSWSQQAKLLASDGEEVDFFGDSVALSGDTALVGAPFDDNVNGIVAGSAYVFVRSGVSWSQQAKLLASDGAPVDVFGVSVGLSGDAAVVGAPGDDVSGSAYAFARDGTSWSERVKLLASDGAAEDQFGDAVAVSGDRIIVGAQLGGDAGDVSGSAYVFEDGPITSDVGADPNPASVSQSIALSAHIDDTNTGGASIASAEFEVRDGDGNVVISGTGDDDVCTVPELPCALDGQFDEVAEEVQATLEAGLLEPGVYSACVRGTDALGSVGEFTCDILAVYDPSAGFVTGGGWIDSPAGASVELPEAVGKAQFGFVSRYQKGETVPSGQTGFRFRAGNLDFRSHVYDWLVVAGARAKFKGAGSINGAGNFGFLLTAIDGALNGGGGADRFRIKIWDKDDGDAIVYDNQMGDGDDAALTTTLGGGMIVIHAK